MNHRDQVETAPEGFDILGGTSTCAVAAMAHRTRPLMAVQFHPEVAHTQQGHQILSNFVFGVCGCVKDWDPKDRIGPIEKEIRAIAADRNVFFFVSGGVDSTVAYTLCLRALGPERVFGIYVDTGLDARGRDRLRAALVPATRRDCVSRGGSRARILEGARQASCDPETKRHIIGEQFVAVQERILSSGHFLDGHWILGQGTIYPDTIESGGTAKADVIKTHHNRVAGIQKLIETGRIIEPLASFYKDEVREIGEELGIPAEFLHRHPFPGPGLAIRCLCSETAAPVTRSDPGWLLPIRSVGVKGDSRSYHSVLGARQRTRRRHRHRAGESHEEINRVVGLVYARVGIAEMQSSHATLTHERLERLRHADAIVRQWSEESGFEREVWQFPVVLIPIGAGTNPDSVVLRPIHSVDGMTAQVVRMPHELLHRMTHELLSVNGVCGVFYDLTHKPPGTIEWE